MPVTDDRILMHETATDKSWLCGCVTHAYQDINSMGKRWFERLCRRHEDALDRERELARRDDAL